MKPAICQGRIRPVRGQTSALTVPPTSVPPTSDAASTSVAGTTTPTGRSASDVAAELVALIDGVPRTELKPKEANDITKRIEEVARIASDDPGDTAKKLREAAEQIAKNVSDDATRDQAEELLIDLANTLGLSDAAVTDAFAN